MAIKAVIGTDFTSFFDAVKKADVTLQGFEGSAVKVEKSLGRMTDSFKGTKLISDATLMAQAIENAGGVATLTGKQLEIAGAKAEEAAQKMRLVGEQVPENLQKVADAATQAQHALGQFDIAGAIEHPFDAATKALTTFLQTIGPIGQVALIAGSALAAEAKLIYDFATKAADAGEKVQHLSDKTGIAVPALSRMGQAATIAGGDLEQIGNAIFMFDKQLADSPAKVVAGLTKLGLSLADIKAMKPEDQFNAIAAAMAGMSDTQARNAAGAELFGRQARELMPLLVNLGAAMEKATGLEIWTPEQAKQAEQFNQDLRALQLAADDVAIAIGKDLIPVLKSLADFAVAHKGGLIADIVGSVENVGGIKGLEEVRLIMAWVDAHTPTGQIGALPTLPAAPPTGDAAGGFKAANAAMVEQVTAAAILDNHLSQLRNTSIDLTTAQRAQATAMLTGGDSIKYTAELLSVSELAVKNLEKALTTAQSQAAQFAKAQAALAEALAKANAEAEYQTVGTTANWHAMVQLRDEVDGRLNAAFAAHYELLERIIPATKDWNSLLAITPGEIIETSVALTDFAHVGEKIAIEVLPGMATGSGIAGFAFDDLAKRMGQISSVLSGVQGAWADYAKISIHALEGVAKAMANEDPLGAVIAGVTGGVAILTKLLSGIGGPSKDELAARDTFGKSFKSVQDAIDQIGPAYAAMGKDGVEAQQDLQRALDATHVSSAAEAAALQIINDKLAAGKLFAANVATALTAVVNAGKNIPGGLTANLQAAVRSLLTMKGVTADTQAALQALLDSSQANFDQLDQIAAKYGNDLAGLGPQFAQGDLNNQAAKLYDDFQQLVNGGADVGGTLDLMKSKWADFAKTALASGSTVPEALRPILQSLADAGDLTDTNGNKLTDLSQFKFADTPLATGIDTLAKAIDHLSQVLGGIPGQFDKIGSAINGLPPVPGLPTSSTEPVTAPVSYGSMGGMMNQGVIYAARGFVPRGIDRYPAMIASGESILTRKATALLGGSAISALNQGQVPGGGGSIHTHVYLNGREIATAVSDQQAQDYRRRYKVRAA